MKHCQKCKKEDDELRTIWMSCFYDMNELEIPFENIDFNHGEFPIKFFTLLVCKACRSTWLKTIKAWYETTIQTESCGSGIFVREFGATVEITEEEWYKRNPDRKPIIFKKD